MGEALDRMHATRSAVVRLSDVQLAIMMECEDWRPPGVKKPGVSDPTANQAIYRADYLANRMESLKQEEHELIEFIGTSLRLLQHIRDGLGKRYGDILEWLYVDCLTWAEIRDTYHVPKSTGDEWRKVACDWVDSLGLKKVLRGEYEL